MLLFGCGRPPVRFPLGDELTIPGIAVNGSLFAFWHFFNHLLSCAVRYLP